MNNNTSAYLRFPAHPIALASDEVPRRSEASLVAIGDDRILAAYADHVGRSDNARSHITLRILDGAGEAIGDEWVAISPPAKGLNAMSPALRRLPDGRIGMLYSFRIGLKEAMRHFVFSEDEGRSWSSPVTVASGGYVTGCHDRLAVLDSGVLVAPLHATDDWEKHYLHVKVATSVDGGLSWTVSAPLELPYVGGPGGIGSSWKGLFYESGCLEPGVVQQADGSLLMTMRTAMGSQFCSTSQDEGASWSSPKTLEVVSPQAPANIARIPGTSILILLWNSDFDIHAATGGDRRCIMSGLSIDGGKTWPHEWRRPLINDDISSWDYPSILFHNEQLWMSIRHTHGGRYLEKPTSTYLMKVPIDWLVSPLGNRIGALSSGDIQVTA